MSSVQILDFSELVRAAEGVRESVIAVGVFDGVHLGHRNFLAHLIERAHQEKAGSAVVTFWPHPRNVLHPESPVASVTSLDERVKALQACGLNDIVVLRFDEELAKLSAGDFVSALKDSLNMRGLVVGHDFALGRGREGTPAVLKDIGRRLGFWVEETPAVALGRTVISSTAIRDAVGSGDVVSARGYLGRPFSIDVGQVDVTQGVAVDFHVPPPQLLPESGTYHTKAWIGDEPYASRTEVDRTKRSFRVELPRIATFLWSHLRIQFLDRVDESRPVYTFGVA